MPRPRLYERTFKNTTRLGAALLACLRANQWTLEQLSIYTKVSPPHLSRLITATTNSGFSIRTVARIAKALNVPIRELV